MLDLSHLPRCWLLPTPPLEYVYTGISETEITRTNFLQYWGTEECYSSPGRSPNKCNESQKKGFDWSGLSTGPFSQYGGMSFSGFTCSNGLGGASHRKRGVSGNISLAVRKLC